jgi:hypothetical protein
VPLSVAIDGRPITRAPSVEALRRADMGWTVVRSPFPGIVLKLAPRGGATDVRLTLRQPS